MADISQAKCWDEFVKFVAPRRALEEIKEMRRKRRISIILLVGYPGTLLLVTMSPLWLPFVLKLFDL